MTPLLSTLPLFPAYSLDTSILVAVLVGVVVLALLTETLGWVFVGLVVPGYLASVFVIRPEAGATVVAEAVLTYAVALALSAGASRTGAWSPFFGRDRFFLIVLASVLVRAVSESWLLPVFGRWADARFGTRFSLDGSLHSIGLVLVPLTANAFWKLKLRRGLLQTGVPVLLTWALLRFVLLPATNLSFGSLEMTYEDVAQDFLASPKAYILLLTTALLAARFNLKYGWDFNGILVPALIALTWLEPTKLLATLAEVLVLVLLARGVLALPGLRTFNWEGPRKTLLVFGLGFLVKYAVGWALGGRVPGLKVTDLFGFGYLVPTLLAVKILQKQVIGRIVLATVHTSLAGVALGSLVGFGLSLVEPRPAQAVTSAASQAPEPGLGLAQRPEGVLALARAGTREAPSADVPLRRGRGELRRWAVLWRALDGWLVTDTASAAEEARALAARLDLELAPLPVPPGRRAAWVLRERQELAPRRGWDTALLFPGAPGPVLEVPRPAREAPGAEAALALCARVDCRAVVVSGTDAEGDGDAVHGARTPIGAARAALAGRPRVQLRADAALEPGHARLHVPAGAPAPAEALWPSAERTALAPPDGGLAWEEGEAAVLRAHPSDLLAVALERAPVPAEPVALDALAARLAAPALAAPAQPTPGELWVLQEQVAAVLLAPDGEGLPTPQRARWAAAVAGWMGLAVHPVTGCEPSCWWVTDADAQRGRLGAGLLVRTGAAPRALEVPRAPEEPGTLALALELWRAGEARALVLAAAAPPGAPAPSPAEPGRWATAFQAFHQAAHRALPARDGLVLQLRGRAPRAGLDADVLAEAEAPVLGAASAPPPLAGLFSPRGALGWLGPRVRFHDGAAELAGLSDASPQRAQARTFGGAGFATLWLSERLRGAYAAPRRLGEQLALVGLGAPAPEPVERALLGARPLVAAPGAPPPALAARLGRLAELAQRAVAQQDVYALRALARAGRSERDAVRVRHSEAHALDYLVLEARAGRRVLRGLYFLSDAPAADAPVRLDAGRVGEVRAALARRAPVWVWGEQVEEEGRR